jgi:hypothetical protein
MQVRASEKYPSTAPLRGSAQEDTSGEEKTHVDASRAASTWDNSGRCVCCLFQRSANA